MHPVTSNIRRVGVYEGTCHCVPTAPLVPEPVLRSLRRGAGLIVRNGVMIPDIKLRTRRNELVLDQGIVHVGHHLPDHATDDLEGDSPRVVRGDAFLDDASDVRSGHRNRSSHGFKVDYIGFHVVSLCP